MKEPAVHKLVIGDVRGRLRGGHERDPLAHDATDNASEQRVVRAPQDQRVHARFLQRRQILARHGLDLLASGHPGLDELDKSGTRLLADRQPRHGCERAQVCLGLDGGLRTDDTHVVVTCGDDALARGRGNDLDNGDSCINPVAFPSVSERGGRRRVARDDERLHAARGQLVEGGQRQRAYLRDSSRAVRRVLGVAQVDDLFVGQFVDDCARHRQPT